MTRSVALRAVAVLAGTGPMFAPCVGAAVPSVTRQAVVATPDHRAAPVLGAAPIVSAAAVLSATPPRAEAIVALRGYSAVAPENTLAAIRAALSAGAPRVWLDVRTTSDGALVLMRDPTLDRTTNCAGRVSETPAAIVTACNAGRWFDPSFASEAVPLLADALSTSAMHPWLMLHDAGVPAVLDTLRSASALGRVKLVSESLAALRAVEAAAPEVSTWVRRRRLDNQAIADALSVGADGLAVDAVGLAPRDVTNVRSSSGLRIAAVDVADEATLFAVEELGVEWMMTGRLEPAIWALGYEFRSYDGEDMGRADAGGQGFPSTLAIGDFNADGRDDLIVAAPADGGRVAGGGWLGVVIGSDLFPGNAISVLPTQLEPNGAWGSVVAIGDYNADGFDDLAVGYPASDVAGAEAGGLWLFDGSPSGLGGAARPIGARSEAGSRMGAALATGDFNGDTVDDLAISRPGAAVDGEAGAGQVILMPGKRGSGPVNTGALIVDRAVEDVPGAPATREGLGSALAAGDFDGDGKDDLAVGVPQADPAGERDAGSVVVVYGGVDGATGAIAGSRYEEVRRGDPAVPGEATVLARFGAALVAADFDGDQLDDLAIGSPKSPVAGRAEAGEVVVLYGARSGLDAGRAHEISQKLPSLPGEPEARAHLGAVLAGGDLNGDGRTDLVLAMPERRAGAAPSVGQVLVVYGGRDGLNPRVALQLAPGMGPLGFERRSRQSFGSSIAVGDMNGDAAADLLAAVPGMWSGTVAGAGALVVGWGYDAALPGVPTATRRPPTRTPRPTVTSTPRPTGTPLPQTHIYLPYSAMLATHGRWPTPGVVPMPPATLWVAPAAVDGAAGAASEPR